MTDSYRNQLANFQLDIAKRWLRRGEESCDVFFQFFCFFTGFNALYFLWGKLDGLTNDHGNPAGEEKQIHHLIEKFGGEQTARVRGAQAVKDAIQYFGHERDPIQRMGKRNRSSPESGDPSEGAKWKRQLGEQTRSTEQLKALASVLYLVRCNLVHGSKSESGDDAQIIRKAVSALKELLSESIQVTEREASRR